MEFPMRINKYLAFKNIASRREADLLIVDKKVFINGKLATLGDKVNEKDLVEIKDKKETPYLYFAYNKPIGILTHGENNKDKNIEEVIKGKNGERLFPIGRLDKDSHGLIILTNDGRITDKLLNPKFSHEKEYIVKTKKKLRNNFKEKIEAGINIEGYKTKPAKVKIINDNTFSIILTEGKKHQIRRMVVALFNEVEDLKRIRILNINLKDLKRNQMREIKGKELETFLEKLNSN